ncbi:hypothetical protein NE237_022361 [Protea cynaroides]|uniref:Uncharacterized protein n=1 Tax=Protea cynaroides TaxID=273540 RepID=A0A9Q0H9J9_9MAGN|nr:hypothetical protein NE237_022361 [Protea cynaroides]
MSKGKGSKQTRLSRFIRAPVRILCKARDFYIQSLTSCAENIRYTRYNDTMALPTAPTSTLPKSFSVSSSRSLANYDEDFRELLRVASLRTLEDKFGQQSHHSTRSLQGLVHPRRKLRWKRKHKFPWRRI